MINTIFKPTSNAVYSQEYEAQIIMRYKIMTHRLPTVLLIIVFIVGCSSVGGDRKNDDAFWNNGRPLWKDLERIAGTGSDARVISWEDGCFLCEAENDASLTKCYATVAEAKASGWSNGFSGFHPQVKAWCSPSLRPIGGVNMDLNTSTRAIMLR